VTVHWAWGLTTATLLAVVIHLNGRGIRLGWLLGALVQLVNMGFGWIMYHQWTFGFLAIPAALFLINWWKHPQRVRPRPIVALIPVDEEAGHALREAFTPDGLPKLRKIN
jgi:hypothetical protein